MVLKRLPFSNLFARNSVEYESPFSVQTWLCRLETARKMGLTTISLTGRDGGAIAKAADYPLNVSSNLTPRVQEAHITAGHVICEMIDYKLFQKPEQ